MSIVTYNAEHCVAVCVACKTCLIPLSKSWERHFRNQPHQMTGDILKSTLRLLEGLHLRSVDELKANKPRTNRTLPIKGLETYIGYNCLQEGCLFNTRYLPTMQRHVSTHGLVPKEHHKSPLWKECLLQTYFTAKGRIDYFVVLGPEAALAERERRRTTHNDEIFDKLKQNIEAAADDLLEQGGIVQDEVLKAATIPWLRYTGFPGHIRGLRDSQIKSSITLPPKGVIDSFIDGDLKQDNYSQWDNDLLRILIVVETMLRNAYTQVCATSESTSQMNPMRATILNQFYARSLGSSTAKEFRPYKNESTLTKYFKVFKQFLAYYYRVVIKPEGHFIVNAQESKDGTTPLKEIIEVTNKQKIAINNLVTDLARDGDNKQRITASLHELIIALICHQIGGKPFRSAILSFCAMLCRKVYLLGSNDANGSERYNAIWQEPGDFNSNLSALTWVAQLIIFNHVCIMVDDDEVPNLLKKFCLNFLERTTETPFGHILQWRLYLFKVDRESVAKNQARWSIDGESVVYLGTELRIDHIKELIISEFNQAWTILYNELLFKCPNLIHISSSSVKDDLDIEEFGVSWIDNNDNKSLILGHQHALLDWIRQDNELRNVYLQNGQDINLQAIKLYESYAQEFLARLLVLCHIAPGPPLRSPELLSVTIRNTSRRRHIYVYNKLVMIYVQYHKNQEQTGSYKENIRYLPQEIGDLLLMYQVYVLPLRQAFLRVKKPKAIISPYLWATLDNKVWQDPKLSSHLNRACIRAKVPAFKAAWWRQVAASITKEKFSPKERANFQGINIIEEVEDELDLVDLAQMSNHSFQTFNNIYAGTTTLTTSTLLLRAYRASISWKDLFQLDQVLHKKRPASSSLDLSAYKKARPRQLSVYSEAHIIATARRIYNNPTLQFRTPGQRDSLLTILGSEPPRQVIVILGTGSGKSLTFMVGAALEDASVTILVLPTIALRVNMKQRLAAAKIPHHVWSIGSTLTSKIVIVSAEIACTTAFLDYAHRLVLRQKLDRIVVDECHLTITANDYRKCMDSLGWYLAQIRTQTVWLTATLPPLLEETFCIHNKLNRPHIIREATNRSNIKYRVCRIRTNPTLAQAALQEIRSLATSKHLCKPRDKMIVYCQTKAMVQELGDLLKCPTLIGGMEIPESEKQTTITTWLNDANSKVIIATSALGVGFDYPYVKYVIHIDAPSNLLDFVQESGRAGRAGEWSQSTVLLSKNWKPSTRPTDDMQDAMQLYLTMRYCARGVISQFLDELKNWRWCMTDEAKCGACRDVHNQPRPRDLVFSLFEGNSATQEPGPIESRHQDHIDDDIISSYEKDLQTHSSCCLYCRVLGREFNHIISACQYRWDWINAKKNTIKRHSKNGRSWLPKYIVCWRCYQPQRLCRVADPEAEDETICRYNDTVLPLCYGAFRRPGQATWFRQQFNRGFQSTEEYMAWLGEPSKLGNIPCIKANNVARAVLQELE